MNKTQAEQILEIDPPYTYAELRKAWRQRCLEYHPDRCATTGMSPETANEVLREINEAFEFLKEAFKDESGQEDNGDSGAANIAAIYMAGKMMMEKASSPQEWLAAESIFHSISGFMDSDAMAEMCAFAAEVSARAQVEGKNEAPFTGANGSLHHHCAIVLDNAFDAHQEVAQAIERISDMGIEKANDLVASAPCTILDGLEVEEALYLCPTIAEAGGLIHLTRGREMLAYRHTREWDTERKAKCARDKSTPQSVLYELAGDADVSVVERVAANPHTPSGTLEKLAYSHEVSIRMNAASNPSTPEKPLKRLANDADERVRWNVSRNPSSPSEALLIFAGEKSFERQLAAHKNTPPELLAKIVDTLDYEIKEIIAGNPSTPPEVLQKLAMYESIKLRIAVASNKSTPPHVLNSLAADKKYQVRVAATQTLREKGLE